MSICAVSVILTRQFIPFSPQNQCNAEPPEVQPSPYATRMSPHLNKSMPPKYPPSPLRCFSLVQDGKEKFIIPIYKLAIFITRFKDNNTMLYAIESSMWAFSCYRYSRWLYVTAYIAAKLHDS